MGDSSCIGEDFSHGPEASNGEGEVDLVSALRESVSFGRFMSESLDWGKWSSFRHNSHLEEVGKYSRPGSVAQKKAYFEAHYKRIAAKKSAALQGQADGTAISAPESESSNVAVDNGNEICSSDTKAESEELSSEVAANKVAKVETPIIDTDLLPSASESNLEIEMGSPVIGETLVGSSLRNESTEMIEDVENQNKDPEAVFSSIGPLEKQPLKESYVVNQEFKDSAEKKPRVPISKSTLGSKNYETILNDRNKSTPKSLHMSIHFNHCQGGTTPLAANTSTVVKKVGDLKVASNSSKASLKRLLHLRTPIKASSNGLEASRTPRSEKGSLGFTNFLKTKTPSQQMVFDRRKEDKELLSICCSKSPSTKGIRVLSSSPRFRTDERAEKRKEFSLNLEDKADAKEVKKAQVQKTSKMNREARKCHKRLHPYITTFQELYDGRNAEQRHSRAPGDYAGTPRVQSLSSSPSRIASPSYSFRDTHNGLEGLQVKDPYSQLVDPSGLPTSGQPVPRSSSGQVRSVLAPECGQVNKTVSKNACKNVFAEEYISMGREKPRQYVEAIEKGRQYEDPYSIHECIVAFNQMHGFTPEEMVMATKVFKDSSNREVFLSLKEDQRGFWLKAMFEEV